MSDQWGAIRREPADVLLAEGVTVRGSLHLLSRDAYPPGPETPLEMLNRGDTFFALTQAEGGVLFLPKHQTMVVSCQLEALPTDPDRLSAAKVLSLEIVLLGGAVLSGRAAVELPPMRARTIDFLNSPGGFFALWNDGVAHYVNKLLVRTIRPHD
jgi:hypothetical protein